MAETGGCAESIKDSTLCLSISTTLGSRLLGSLFDLAVAYSLEVVGYTTMVAYLAVGRAVTLRDLGGRVLAMPALATIRAQFGFVGSFVILELLLLATTVLTASSIGAGFLRGVQQTFYQPLLPQ